MPTMQPRRWQSAPSPAFILLCLLLAVLWLAGGSSRPDALGQAVSRGAAWLSLTGLILAGGKPALRGVWPVALLLGLGVAVPLLQLIPLPPAIWQELPGRELLAGVAGRAAVPPAWRPLSIAPGATMNAVASLIVPVAVLILATATRPDERVRLPAIVLGLAVAALMLGILQVIGAGYRNPFAGSGSPQISGMFANRNHFALLMAMGCLVAPVWAFATRRHPGWRGGAALGLVLLFALIILASGSRAGVVAILVSLPLGFAIALAHLRRALKRVPRWVLPALTGAALLTILIFVLLSIAADRAVSVNRLLVPEAGVDMRTRSLPIVSAMVQSYFPAGAGFGTFDAAFRMAEPDSLLQVLYLNHVHNDFVEVVLDGGLAGAALLLAGLGWWLWASWRAWRPNGGDRALARLGSGLLLLVLGASIVDYPARTPLLMATIIIAGLWLNGWGAATSRSALPVGDQQL